MFIFCFWLKIVAETSSELAQCFSAHFLFSGRAVFFYFLLFDFFPLCFLCSKRPENMTMGHTCSVFLSLFADSVDVTELV